MLIHLICAARPNFMKIAPLYHALKKTNWARPVIVHTGQHYDLNMSDAFFADLGLPAPDINLDVRNGSHAQQTGKVMIAYEELLMEQRPDLVVVVGDVNSTMAATLAATKVVYPVPIVNSINPINPIPNHAASTLGRPPGGRPAVLRRTMPEELNRLVTDVLADILWTPSRDADENLIREGIAPEKIQMVGNIMIDSLEMLRGKIESQKAYLNYGLKPGGYGVVTLHRPSNVDNPEILKAVVRQSERHRTAGAPGVPRSPEDPQEPGGESSACRPGKHKKPVHARTARLHLLHEPGVQLRLRDHRLRRHPGGDELSRHPLPHGPGKHGAARHHHARHQPPVPPGGPEAHGR